MIRKILREIQKLEDNKQKLIEQQKAKQLEIEKNDIELKRALTLKKEYEKLEKNVLEYFNKN